MGKQPKRSLVPTLLFCLMLFTLFSGASCNNKTGPPAVAQPPADERLQEAIKRLEEDRGTPMGRKAPISVPSELKHYADRRRFLAVQNAAWSEWHYEIPQGYLELLALIEKGGLVEMETLGDAYVLYGAGENATTARFTHFDATSGKTIPLFASKEEFAEEQARLNQSIFDRESKKVDLQLQLSRTPAKARSERKNIITRMAEQDKEIKETKEDQNRMIFFYTDDVRRTMMFAEYQWIKTIAADFRGRSYDIANPAERRQFKMRLLAFTRPQTRAVIEEISRRYKERFNRHLPITSLYRTIEYQAQLRETNPNAARVDVPPHTTGLAFDIYNRYMNAEEQDFLMNIIARMKANGRVEALRENRDHIHVFAFPEGRPPGEKLIAKALQ